MKRFATLFAVVGLFALTGCNTVKGVGQDVQKAGSAIENAAKK
ncbi:MAG: entericidin A/B family lipoprotein [Comamonadaceae bacterium]|jgi:predicted small secreted protein|nr:entericidin A/B family lipoprotein [Comamonadaceae bacterium]MBK9200353.1 entericidin A/B family lipoprotein [Betaproteobacteria bacterium]MBP6309017.1 entericidin A/B family lipoprotein [Burkholderiaceae bacterium]MBK7118449.1 entericidin A/B family lipoprotein [Comamonadaceae bacterium]MBK7988981.1 entericidin A/B family lipoprotein [Comamonadaceae bacterium]